MEDGKGRERDEVLAKLNIDTFLIIPPKQLLVSLITALMKRKTLANWIFGAVVTFCRNHIEKLPWES